MRDRVYLGPAPAEETCVQVGDPDYAGKSIVECRHYIVAIKAVCGEPPEGALLRVVSEQHDYGTYREVVCEFDGNNPDAAAYAYKCDEFAPTSWEAANMATPVAKKGRRV